MSNGKWKALPWPFSPVPVHMVKPLMESGILSKQAAVLLTLIGHRYDGPHGEILMSHPRDAIAKELGIESEAVRRAIKHLIAKGAIRKSVMGYKGKTSVYEFMCQQRGTPDSPQRTKGDPGGPIGGPGGSQRGTSGVPPTRTKEELIRSAQPVRPSQATAGLGADRDMHVTRNEKEEPMLERHKGGINPAVTSIVRALYDQSRERGEADPVTVAANAMGCSTRQVRQHLVASGLDVSQIVGAA